MGEWTKQQRERFEATMKKKAKEKKAEGETHFPVALIPDKLPPATKRKFQNGHTLNVIEPALEIRFGNLILTIRSAP